MANLIGFLKRDIIAPVQRVIQNDVVQPYQRDIVAPIQQAVSNPNTPVLGPLLQADRGIVNAGRNVVQAPVAAAKLSVANITHNPMAQSNAMNQLTQAQHSIGGLAQGLARSGVQLEQSIRPGGIRQPVVPTNPFSRALLGNQPVNSLQQDYSNMRNSGMGRLNALTNTGISLAGDLPVGYGAARLGTKGVTAFDKAITTRVPAAGNLNVGRLGGSTKNVPEVPKNVGRTSEQISLDKTAPTNIDRIMANQTNTPLSKIMSDKQVAQARLKGGQDALLHLQSGGSREGAIKLYQKATNASDAMAKYKVSLVARSAKTPLNVSETATNPLEGKFNLPQAKPGEYLRARQNQMTVNTNIDKALSGARSAFNQLTTKDRQAVPDYLEGTKNISKADNPVAVRQAMVASKAVIDTGHALGSPYAPAGKNAYIKRFFPRYYADVPGQSAKAQAAIEEAALAGKPVPLEDPGNYMGFHQKSREFATRQEARQAGFKFLHSDPLQDLERYGAGAKINIGNEAFKGGAAQADINASGQLHTIDLPGSGTARVSSAAYKSLKNYAVKPPANLLKKGLQGVNTTVIKTIVANPIFHGGNQEFNALFQGATRLPGNKFVNFGNVLKRQFGISEADRTAFYREGNFSPTYGKDNYGFIAKGLQNAGLDPAKAEISPRAMARIEENIRIGLWKQAKARGMGADEATATINKVLGAPDVLGDMSNSVLLFYHYLKTNVKLLGDTGKLAAKGNMAPLIGLAAGGAAWYAVDKAWQKATGNPKATVRAPGALGTLLQLAKAPGQIHAGRIPSVVTNHVNPLITTGIEQATNRDLHRTIIGSKAQYNSLDGKYGSGRLNTAASNLVGPVGTVQDIAGNKTSLPYGTAGYLTGFYNSKPSPNAPPTPGQNPATLTTTQKNTLADKEKSDLNKNAGNGYSLQQLSNGKYAYTLDGDTTVHVESDKQTAQSAIAEDTLKKSGDPYKIVKDVVYRKGPGGKVTTTTLDQFNVDINTANLTHYKNTGDLTSWLNTAKPTLDLLNKEISNPNTDPLDAIKYQNQADAIQKNIDKYTGYGGFTKPKAAPKARGAKVPKVRAVKSPKISGIKVRSLKVPKAPRAPRFKAPTTRKISVSKLPKIR